MPKKIEIFENTLLKLLIRRGTDVDRRNITLSEGELGYTVDTKKLYIGDGQTKGGIPVAGSAFLGSVPDVTVFTSAVSGDLAYDTDDNIFYSFKGGNPANITDWQNIGGTYSAGNGTISISNTNRITVNRLSAGNFSADALGSSLRLDSSNRIALNSTIAVNTINLPVGDSYLNTPANFTVNGQNFTWPSDAGSPNLYLTSDGTGALSWQPAFDSSIFVAGTASQIPVGSIMPFISAGSAPNGWLLCNGQSVPGSSYRELSAVIGTTYGGNSTNFNVPNFVNRAIYGVASSPSTSTTFNIASGNNSVLSASGALYIIKAKPDTVVNSTITIIPPLTASLNGNSITGGIKVNALSGDLIIGLDSGFIQTVTNGSVPTGAIMAFAADAIPDGWLDCYGDAVSRTTYSNLFSVISTTYGIGDGLSSFNLPDLAGYFIRGYGTNGDGTTSDAIGVKQADAFQGHWHAFGQAGGFECSNDNNACPPDIIQCTASGTTTPGVGSATLQGYKHVRGATTDSINGTPRTAPETRPKNIAMLYCIKY
jgi:microcystin-dependent protein